MLPAPREAVDVLASGPEPPGPDRPPRRGTRRAVAFAAGVLAGMAALAGWGGLAGASRATTGSALTVESAVPFAVERYGAVGALRVRNSGPRAVTLTGLALPGDDGWLTSAALPLTVSGGRTALIPLRVELRCPADGLASHARALRLEVADGAASRTVDVGLDPLQPVLAEARSRYCAVGSTGPPPVTVAYAGLTEVRERRIVTRLLVASRLTRPVRLDEVAAPGGWPPVDTARSTPLPLVLPPSGSAAVDVAWDVSACSVPSSGRFEGRVLVRTDRRTAQHVVPVASALTYDLDVVAAYADLCR